MPSNNIQALKQSIEKTFSEIKARVDEIEHAPGPADVIVRKICDYVGNRVSAESKLLLVSLCSKLEDETLASEPFKTTKRQNIFYRKNLCSLIYNKYNFAANETIDYSDAAKKYTALTAAAGIIGIGSVLSIALHQTIIIPVAVLVAGGLYYAVSRYEKGKSQKQFSKAIQDYLDSVEKGLVSWLENIETFFYEQVEELKKSMEETNNGQ